MRVLMYHSTCDANAHCALKDNAGPEACTVTSNAAKSLHFKCKCIVHTPRSPALLLEMWLGPPHSPPLAFTDNAGGKLARHADEGCVPDEAGQAQCVQAIKQHPGTVLGPNSRRAHDQAPASRSS